MKAALSLDDHFDEQSCRAKTGALVVLGCAQARSGLFQT